MTLPKLVAARLHHSLFVALVRQLDPVIDLDLYSPCVLAVSKLCIRLPNTPCGTGRGLVPENADGAREDSACNDGALTYGDEEPLPIESDWTFCVRDGIEADGSSDGGSLDCAGSDGAGDRESPGGGGGA